MTEVLRDGGPFFGQGSDITKNVRIKTTLEVFKSVGGVLKDFEP